MYSLANLNMNVQFSYCTLSSLVAFKMEIISYIIPNIVGSKGYISPMNSESRLDVMQTLNSFMRLFPVKAALLFAVCHFS